MIQIVICDDEDEDCKKIENLIRKYASDRLLEVAIEIVHDRASLFECLKYEKDLILLDIGFPKDNGIEIADILYQKNVRSKIIFVTNNEKLVFAAIAKHPYGFVRKKRMIEELPQYLDDFFEKLQKEEIYFIETESGIFCRKLIQLYYLESYSHTIILHWADGSIHNINNRKKTLDSLENELRLQGFIRVHKSFLVNIKAIRQIHQNEVELKDGNRIMMSRRRRKNVTLCFMNQKKS